MGHAVRTLAEMERDHILNTLTLCGNNRTHAAKLLNISVRCLRNKLHLYEEQGFQIPPPPNRQEENWPSRRLSSESRWDFLALAIEEYEAEHTKERAKQFRRAYLGRMS